MIPEKNEILQGLRLAPKIFASFVTTLPESVLNKRRGEGFWTIAEHIDHLAQVQPMLLARFQRFINEECPVFVPFIPTQKDEKAVPPPLLSPGEAIRQMEAYRNEQVTLLESAGDDIWQRRARHPEYDDYSFHILARHVLLHDHWHMYRMEELWLTKDEFLTQLF